MAIKNMNEHYEIWKLLPKKINLCDGEAVDAVIQNGYMLQYVNEQTEDICLAAVNQDSYSLRYVNEQIFSQGNSIDRATVIEYLEWFRVNVDIGPSEGDAIDQMNAKFQKETGKNLPEGWNYDSSGEINDKI